jgi:hypothetical protein
MGGPSYRGLRLDGPLDEFRRAVDRLRADTIPTLLTHQRPAGPPPRQRPDRQRRLLLLDPKE